MDVPNISLLFNKILFKRLDDSVINPNKQNSFKEKTKEIHKKLFTLPLDLQIASLLDVRNNVLPDKNRVIETFDLTTAWPGLLIGLGYGHSTGNSDDEFKNGFYFDFTTGLPILPGSTVKGILRSFFPERYDISVNDKKLRVEVLAKKSNVLKRLISILNDLDIKPNISFGVNEWNEETIKELENIIFEGKVTDNKISSNIQDVFFDAFPKNAGKSNVVEGNISREYNGVFLGEDTITPHRHPLKDPVPLRFLKVLPGVTFQFQFFLNCIGISNEDKRKLFEKLLLRFGAGAKNSVGFGKFKEAEELEIVTDTDWFIGFQPLKVKIWNKNINTEEEENADEEDEFHSPKVEIKENKIKNPEVIETYDWINPLEIKRGNFLKATILSSLNGNQKVLLHIKTLKITQNLPGKGEVNSIIDVKVQNIEGNISKGNFNVKVIKV